MHQIATKLCSIQQPRAYIGKKKQLVYPRSIKSYNNKLLFLDIQIGTSIQLQHLQQKLRESYQKFDFPNKTDIPRSYAKIKYRCIENRRSFFPYPERSQKEIIRERS